MAKEKKNEITQTNERFLLDSDYLKSACSKPLGIDAKIALTNKRKKIEIHIDTLKQAAKPPKEYNNYLEALRKLRVEYLKKDAKGNIIFFKEENGKGGRSFNPKKGFPVIVREEELNRKIEALEEENKEYISAAEKLDEEANGKMLDDVTIDVGEEETISKSDLHNELDGNEMDVIMKYFTIK